MTDSNILSIIFISFGLSADCFAVALSGGISTKIHSWLKVLRLSFSFGLFQALMPVLGWLAGRTIVDYIVDYDHWVAFALLGAVSSRMFWGAMRHENSQENDRDITKGFILLILSIATSIDALAVGLSFAFLDINITLASAIIGAVAFIFTAIGFLLGRKASDVIGKRAEIVGGIILLAIAVRILLSHIM